MDFIALANRFRHYAQVNIDLAYDPSDTKSPSYLEGDVDDLQSALKNGLKLPCLLLQIPEIEKKGQVDSVTEFLEGSFIVLMQWKPGMRKLQLYRDCKAICDQLINYIIEDSDAFFEGGMPETSEGHVGPMVDGLCGWGVNFGFNYGYNGEVDEAKRREIQ